MSSNIYQVLKEVDLNEILNDQSQSLVLVMFSAKNCKPCSQIKPKFINLSKENPKSHFVYIDVDNFENNTFEIQGTPKFLFYFDNQVIAEILGAQEESLSNTFSNIKNKIESKKKEYSKQETISEDIEQKIQLLKKLYELSQSGAKLSKFFNLDSDLEEMKMEYELHCNKKEDDKAELLKKLEELKQMGFKLSKNYNLESNYESMLLEYNFFNNNKDKFKLDEVKVDDNELLKKQDQVRKIQELNRLNYMMQIQHAYKLEQLKQLQKMKEENEKSKKSKDNN